LADLLYCGDQLLAVLEAHIILCGAKTAYNILPVKTYCGGKNKVLN